MYSSIIRTMELGDGNGKWELRVAYYCTSSRRCGWCVEQECTVKVKVDYSMIFLIFSTISRTTATVATVLLLEVVVLVLK